MILFLKDPIQSRSMKLEFIVSKPNGDLGQVFKDFGKTNLLTVDIISSSLISAGYESDAELEDSDFFKWEVITEKQFKKINEKWLKK